MGTSVRVAAARHDRGRGATAQALAGIWRDVRIGAGTTAAIVVGGGFRDRGLVVDAVSSCVDYVLAAGAGSVVVVAPRDEEWGELSRRVGRACWGRPVALVAASDPGAEDEWAVVGGHVKGATVAPVRVPRVVAGAGLVVVLASGRRVKGRCLALRESLARLVHPADTDRDRDAGGVRGYGLMLACGWSGFVGIVVGVGDGRWWRRGVEVVAGVDPVAVDVVAESRRGRGTVSIAALRSAERLGLGEARLDAIEIVGEPGEAAVRGPHGWVARSRDRAAGRAEGRTR